MICSCVLFSKAEEELEGVVAGDVDEVVVHGEELVGGDEGEAGAGGGEGEELAEGHGGEDWRQEHQDGASLHDPPMGGRAGGHEGSRGLMKVVWSPSTRDTMARLLNRGPIHHLSSSQDRIWIDWSQGQDQSGQDLVLV